MAWTTKLKSDELNLGIQFNKTCKMPFFNQVHTQTYKLKAR